jgi:DNA-binding CsgD family transcriptional regulator
VEPIELDLAAVVDTRSGERCVLVASNLFAATAIPYAAHQPERLKALVLINPSATTLGLQESTPSLLQLAETDWDFFLEVIARTDFSHEEPGLAKGVLRECTSQADFLTTWKAFLKQDYDSLLPSIKVPTLVINPPAGHYTVHDEICKRIAGRIPDARLVRLEDREAIASTIEAFVAQLTERPNPRQSSYALPPLSAREREVLRYLAVGHSNEEIARALVISASTVAKHVTNILAKTETKNRTQAADFARRTNLVPQ